MKATPSVLTSTLLLGGLLLPGCQEAASEPIASSAQSTPAASGPAAAPPATSELPTASIGVPIDAEEELISPDEDLDLITEQLPEKGTLAWNLLEITRLMVPPPIFVETEDAAGNVTRAPRETADITAERKGNLEQVVIYAGQVIAQTHADATQDQLFNNAVHYLCTAEVELALLGDDARARHLNEVAETLFAEKPNSPAASEASFRLFDLAKQMTAQYGRQNQQWAEVQAKQACLFAERFPKDEGRACVALLETGRMCESLGMSDEARRCYFLIEEKFPQSPHAQAIAGALRRLRLEGRTLAAEELGGPTIDGGFVSIDQFAGRHTLVVFWTADSPTFLQDLTKIKALQAQHGNQLAVLGVNLDQEELKVDQLIEAQQLNWPQIFFPKPEQRGAFNVVAHHYGVTTVPSYWLIDPQSKVLKCPANLDEIRIGE